MLAIKLQRIGKKHQPSYRVVVAEKRSKIQGPPVEDLGSYNSFTKKAALKIERLAHWLTIGAQPTMTMHNLLVHEGVLAKPKRAIKMKHPSSSSGQGAEAKPAETVAPVTEAKAA